MEQLVTTEAPKKAVPPMSPTVRELRKAGIIVEDYRKAPAGRDAFVVAIQPFGRKGKLRIHEGNADIEVFPDREQRQAVMNVKEHPHVISRKVSGTFYGREQEKPTEEQATRRLINNFPVQMPDGTRHTVKGLQIKKNRDGYWVASGIVTGRKSQRSRMTFLVGVDEKHHFICALPKSASSVEEAHKILRPEGVPADAPRQGEWFFVPVSQRLEQKLNRIAETNPRRVSEESLEFMSSHIAKQLLRFDGNDYVIGYVHDNRTTRHRGIYLPKWHRVVRNNEVTPKDPVQRAQMRSWD